ncbi:MAG: hypothetical protein WCF84_22885 [Anaerolineae bacterium]
MFRLSLLILLLLALVSLIACSGILPARGQPPDLGATVTPAQEPPLASPLAPTPAMTLSLTSTPSSTATVPPPPASPTLALATPLPVQPVNPSPSGAAGMLSMTRDTNRLFGRDLQTGREWLIAEGLHAEEWSPDGQRLALVNLKQSGPAGEIWIVNRDGSGRRQLTAGPDDGHPRWSPDGQQLLFDHNIRYDAPHAQTLSAEIWVMGGNGENPRKLADGFDPAWSPEGRRIAYATNSQASDAAGPKGNAIGLMNALGANNWTPATMQMPGGPYTTMQWTVAQARLFDQPEWSPDGTEITFRALGGNSAYLTTDATKGGVRQFVALFFDGVPHGFSYSPDGQYITFGTGGQSGVSTVTLYRRGPTGSSGYGSAQSVLVLGRISNSAGAPPQNVDGLAWSPDGARLAYALSTAAAGQSLPQGIYILDLATGQQQVIPDGQAPLFWNK